MPTEKEIYEAHADHYERLIRREDYLNNIPKEITGIRNVNNLDIIELGAGTGRLTRLFTGKYRRWVACDASHPMLVVAKEKIISNQTLQPLLSVAEMQHLPYKSRSADMVIAGWSFCYLAVWGAEAWQQNVDAGLAEARRLLKPGGTFMILENYGTGFENPNPPAHLNAYFDYLKKKGFSSKWFRTDFKFASISEALELTGFFFGEYYADKVKKNNSIILPECTGLFWKNF